MVTAGIHHRATGQEKRAYRRLLEREPVLAGEALLAEGEGLLDTAGEAFLDVAGEFLRDDAGEALLDDVAAPFFFAGVSSFFYVVRKAWSARTLAIVHLFLARESTLLQITNHIHTEVLTGSSVLSSEIKHLIR